MEVTAYMSVSTIQLELTYKRAQGFAKEYVKRAGELLLETARYNVSPGIGPGPHPHVSDHTDTGKLRDALRIVHKHSGWYSEMIYLEVDGEPMRTYGLILELGWHTSTGRFVRYPWMAPALEIARQKAMEIARACWNTHMRYTGEMHAHDVQRAGAYATTPKR